MLSHPEIHRSTASSLAGALGLAFAVLLALACGAADGATSAGDDDRSTETVSTETVSTETVSTADTPSESSARDRSSAGDPSSAGDRRAAAKSSSGKTGTAAWDRVLRAHASDGGIDYAALKKDTGDLDAYLEHVAATDPASLSDDERLAFLINAYNAYVVEAVLERYPGIESVKKVDGFFDGETHTVGGEEMTLDEIEKGTRDLDPRAHFAVVCASTSCPDLRGEAYTAAKVDQQLADQTRGFLADTSKGLRYDAAANDLYLSSIFKWYAQDFTGGSRVVAFFARGGILEWVIEHLGDDELAATLEEREPSVKYMDYDWSLNDR